MRGAEAQQLGCEVREVEEGEVQGKDAREEEIVEGHGVEGGPAGWG